MLPKGILFDLDDTIIAFDAVANPTWKHICETFAHQSSLLTPPSLFKAIQDVRTWFWSDKARHRSGRHNLEQTRREIVRRAFGHLGIDNLPLASSSEFGLGGKT